MKSGLEIGFLFTMLGEDGSTSASHGLNREILDIQANAVGIPIIYGKTTVGTYEEEFKKIIRNQKDLLGIQGGVFGDINLQEHKDWIDRVCSDIGIKPFFPLWHEDYEKLLNEFIGNGFEAMIVSAKINTIEQEWIGRRFDWKFVKYLDAGKLDRLGERGEFHTFVTNGPIFKQRLRIIEFSKSMKDDLWLPEKLTITAL